MRDHEITFAHALVAEQQDVDVDHPRSPAPGRPPASFALDGLSCAQKRSRRAAPLRLHDLVEESRLVPDSPGFCLHDAALTQDPQTLLTQTAASGAQVARTRSQV